MKTEDFRLDKNSIKILKSCIGKTFASMEHDEFMFTNSSLQVIRLTIDNRDIYLYNIAEEQDYFGSIEDVAIFNVESVKYPFVDSKKFITIPINEEIKKIFIVQENQKLFENNMPTYDIQITRGLIFDLGSHQIAFEKAAWLSEDIYIRKGYNLIETFTPANNFCKSENWKKGIRAECIREIEILG